MAVLLEHLNDAYVDDTTQAELAKRVGISHQRVYQLATDGGPMTPRTLRSLLLHYEKDIEAAGLEPIDFVLGL